MLNTRRRRPHASLVHIHPPPMPLLYLLSLLRGSFYANDAPEGALIPLDSQCPRNRVRSALGKGDKK